MGRYDDIDPGDIDPETGAPYAGYSSPALDTSFHDHEMAVDDGPCWLCALGYGPFIAEGLAWHKVNDRDPFRCVDFEPSPRVKRRLKLE